MSRNSPKDSRYRLARETGTVVKDWGGRLPVALVYPNSYYIGMSNLGVHTIYSLLNGYDSIACERFFFEQDTKGNVAPLLSIESERPLPDFPVVAFSLTYEPDYFNVVKVLKASGLPLYAADRDERHPLVIAGGPCIMGNPAPLAPFFDCLCIGEAEALLPVMLPVIEQGAGEDREDLLRELAKLPGIYVPGITADTKVTRQYVQNIDDFPSHSAVMTRDTELGNLYMIEAERGCGHNCRFCMVSNIFSPTRYRSVETILAQAEEGLKHRKRIGLVGPAVSGHPKFEELLAGLKGLGAEISVSSLRIKPLPEAALEELSEAKARTIALAPEAGSQRLRTLIRKGIDEEDILKAMRRAAEHGIRQLKLYFMVGLPTETNEDADEIATLTLKCKEVFEQIRPGCRMTLSVAPFVPKPSTPFEREPMADLPVLNHRISALKKRLLHEGISVKADSPGWSRVQGVLSQGDERLAGVLTEIEDMSLAGWQRALEQQGLTEEQYLRSKSEDEPLPWDFIDPTGYRH